MRADDHQLFQSLAQSRFIPMKALNLMLIIPVSACALFYSGSARRDNPIETSCRMRTAPLGIVSTSSLSALLPAGTPSRPNPMIEVLDFCHP